MRRLTSLRRREAVRSRAIGLAAIAVLTSAAAPVAAYVDRATPFERVALATGGQPDAARIAAVRRALDPLLPGVYAANASTDRRIAKALAEFPAERARYDQAVRVFPSALDSALSRFRTVFPAFRSPLPIYLYHSLGVRDGGSDYLEPGHRHVMFFGADLIAKLHADDTLEPFFDHELFHLEHGRAFPDCDQFWCALWQEGLAVDAAAVMTPGATDHQLLLDLPAPIRAPTDARWAQALCFVATHFDDTADAVVAQAMIGGGQPPVGLPDRFGYYVGYRIAQATGASLPALSRLDPQAARPLVRSTLIHLMTEAKADCAAPAPHAAITHRSAHPV